MILPGMSTDQSSLKPGPPSSGEVKIENGLTVVSNASTGLEVLPTNGTGAVTMSNSNTAQTLQANGNGQQLGASAMISLAKIASEQKPIMTISTTQPSTLGQLIVTSGVPITNTAVMTTLASTTGAVKTEPIIISTAPPVQAAPHTAARTQIVTPVRPAIQPHLTTTSSPIRISQPAGPQQILIPRGANAIPLPPGLALPPGTVLMQKDGQFVFVSRAPIPQNINLQSKAHTSMAMTAPRFMAHLGMQMHGTPGHGQPFASRSPAMQRLDNKVGQQPPFFPTQPGVVNVEMMAGQQGGQLIRPNVIGQHLPQSTAQQVLIRPGVPQVGNAHMRVQVPTSTHKPIMPLPNQSKNKEEIKKCKSFLETLIRLSSQQPPQTLNNVKTLIQGLLDNTVQPEVFTTQLQKELNSQKQPGLTTFLKKSLPDLREAVKKNELTIDGLGSKVLINQRVNNQANKIISAAGPQPVLQLPLRPGTKLTMEQVNALQRPQQIAQQNQVRGPLMTQQIKQMTAANNSKSGTAGLVPVTVNAVSQRNASPTPPKGKQRLDLKDDEDINDVATMGGVNLSEESNILSAAETQGQLRSCRETTFLAHASLLQRIKQRAVSRGVRDVNANVIEMVSHACQERLRQVTEKAIAAAEHRLEVFRVDKRFEQQSDVRAQLKFLEELDKLEKKRHEDSEREMLLRAAKSRSKHEDPEQAKLKQKAKELQQQEMEEIRQREANITALAAIGPRKKRKLDDSPGVSGSGLSTGMNTGTSQQQISLRPRLKRVNIRDLIFTLEQDRESSKSLTVYKSFLR